MFQYEEKQKKSLKKSDSTPGTPDEEDKDMPEFLRVHTKIYKKMPKHMPASWYQPVHSNNNVTKKTGFCLLIGPTICWPAGQVPFSVDLSSRIHDIFE